MSGTEDDLLARLNALKPSSVVPTQVPAVDVQVSNPEITLEDGLAERLKALRSGQASTRLQAAVPIHKPKTDVLTSQIIDEVVAEQSDPIRNWQHQDPQDEDRSLDDLLAELGSGEDWQLDPEDPKHINGLLKEAREALPPSDESQSHRRTSAGERLNDGPEDKDEDTNDEHDAKDYVEKVLAEIDLERKNGIVKDAEPQGEDEKQDRSDLLSGLTLPSTPSNQPQTKEEADSARDDDLASRFSNLGMDLPSTPSSKPTSKKNTTSAKATSNLPKYTDEDIESWCCICNEDGELKCLGCDDDIYCRNCWAEGHGTGPGQERGHRAVQFARKGGGTDMTTS